MKNKLLRLKKNLRWWCLLALGLTQLLSAGELEDVQAHLRRDDVAQALNKLDAWLLREPANLQAGFLRAVVLAQRGRTDEAIAGFEKLTQLHPHRAEPWHNLATLLAQRQDHAGALKTLQGALKAHPQSATLVELLGDVYGQLALAGYKRSQQLKPYPGIDYKVSLLERLYAGVQPLAEPNTAVPTELSQAAPVPPPALSTAPAPPPIKPSEPEPAALKLTELMGNFNSSRDAALAHFERWKKARTEGQLENLISLYDRSFSPPGSTRQRWQSRLSKALALEKKQPVRYGTPEVRLEAQQLRLRFAEHHQIQGKKRSLMREQTLKKTGERWLIVSEKLG